MTQSLNEPDEHDEKPLDPAVERVRRKLMRLMVVSIGIMLIGLFAVLSAVVYRVSEAPRAVIETLELPTGAEIVSHGFGDGVVSILIRLPDGHEEIRLVPAGSVDAARTITITRDP